MSEKVFVSISVPRIAQPIISSGSEDNSFKSDPVLYAVASTIFPLDVETELQPTVLLRYGGGLASYDVGINWVYERFVTIGLFTRELTSFGALMGVRIKEKLTCKYSFEIYTQAAEGAKTYSNEKQGSRKAGKQKSREATKQKRKKQRSRKAGKQAEKQRSRKATKQKSREAEKQQSRKAEK